MPPTSQPSVIEVIVTASNHAVCLTYVMVVLTVAVVVLTFKVKRYAGKTLEVAEKSLKVTQKSLEVTQKSLALLSEPVVWWEQPKPTELKCTPQQECIASGAFTLHNDSVQEIFINEESDIRLQIVLGKSCAYAKHLKVERRKRTLKTDYERPYYLPMRIKRILQFQVEFKKNTNVDMPLPTEDMKITIELAVDYFYRGRRQKLEEEFIFTLKPS